MFKLLYKPLGSTKWVVLDTEKSKTLAVKAWNETKDREPSLPLKLTNQYDSTILPEKSSKIRD